MKYCPYCGAGLLNSTFSFCPECGTRLPTQEEIMAASIDEAPNRSATERAPTNRQRKTKPWKKSRKEKTAVRAARNLRHEQAVTTPSEPPADEYYDGYYDDVMPPDLDREKDGVDKALVKRIIILAMCVTIIIFMCVAFLYVL